MIVPIVEGHSEVESVPVLIRRYQSELSSFRPIAPPIRVKRNRVVKDGELERTIRLAHSLYPDVVAVVLILDADTDCPAELAPSLLDRAKAISGEMFQVAVVLPKVEYESWFIGAIESLRSRRGIIDNATAPAEPEAIGNAKGWGG